MRPSGGSPPHDAARHVSARLGAFFENETGGIRQHRARGGDKHRRSGPAAFEHPAPRCTRPRKDAEVRAPWDPPMHCDRYIATSLRRRVVSRCARIALGDGVPDVCIPTCPSQTKRVCPAPPVTTTLRTADTRTSWVASQHGTLHRARTDRGPPLRPRDHATTTPSISSRRPGRREHVRAGVSASEQPGAPGGLSLRLSGRRRSSNGPCAIVTSSIDARAQALEPSPITRLTGALPTPPG